MDLLKRGSILDANQQIYVTAPTNAEPKSKKARIYAGLQALFTSEY